MILTQAQWLTTVIGRAPYTSANQLGKGPPRLFTPQGPQSLEPKGSPRNMLLLIKTKIQQKSGNTGDVLVCTHRTGARMCLPYSTGQGPCHSCLNHSQRSGKICHIGFLCFVTNCHKPQVKQKHAYYLIVSVVQAPGQGLSVFSARL